MEHHSEVMGSVLRRVEVEGERVGRDNVNVYCS